MSTGVPLRGLYDDRLVVLSVLIAVLAAYAALDLAGRVTTARRGARLAWLCGGATAMGIGIWAMHYIGMEALHLPVPVLYDWPTVLLSLFAAVLASGVALFLVSRPTMGRLSTSLGCIIMGSGIAAMHYIGMEAMRLPAMCVYSTGPVILSVFLAVAISCIALRLAFAFRDARAFWGWRKAFGGLILGLAIPTMHYVGMAAARFMPTDSISGSLAHAVSVSDLGLVCIAIVTLVILTLVFISSTVDRRFALQTQHMEDANIQLKTIFDHMKEGIVVVDHERNIIQKNRAAAHLLGLSDGIISRKEIAEGFELFLPDGTPLPWEQWPTIRALQGEFLENQEFTIRRKDNNKTAIAEISTAPIPSPTGEITQIILSYHDITETKDIDEARTRLAAIVEFSEDAIIGKNDRGIVTSWNKGAEKVFGYTSAEMIGQSVKLLLPEGHEQEEDDILARIKQGDTVDHIESIRKKKDGKLINVSLTISPIRDAWGKVIGASKIARDITDKKQLERQLQQSQKMEAIGQLTGGIAHDFNNLLGVVGNLDLLEGLVTGNEIALKRVQIAQKAAGRGADLTRRLLTFSSNEALKPSPTKLHHSIRNVMELTTRAIGPEIKITTHFDETIPQVFVDAAGLESALLNLVVNARDAMPKGGTLTITMQVSNLEENYSPVHAGELKAGRYACLSISDTGHGMSRGILDRVFEPFFTTKPRGKGTGLGLAMVYGFIKQSGGTVRIYSEPGYGTTVTLYLPFAEGVSQATSKVVPILASTKLSGTVLVVDDELDLLEIAIVYLKEMGYTGYQAKDGTSALEMIEQHRDIDLMVTDIIMPGGMNGVELAQKVRQLLPHIKIIYCSGFPANALAERSMPLVDGPLLHKPYQRAEFAGAIRSVMENGKGGTEA